jgi:ER-Golgi trafficking TRAPP I complex 85 kDa subunit
MTQSSQTKSLSISSLHTHASDFYNVYRAGALFNAVKKQFGLHSYLLCLNLPKPSPKPIPVPALIPRLPSPPSSDSPPPENVTSTHPTTLNTLSMEENDIQQTARFTREFLVMSLIPWMEKCVVDWNENVTFALNYWFKTLILHIVSSPRLEGFLHVCSLQLVVYLVLRRRLLHLYNSHLQSLPFLVGHL